MADGGVATVDPNTGNVQLFQPIDFRKSQASSNNADDIARLAVSPFPKYLPLLMLN